MPHCETRSAKLIQAAIAGALLVLFGGHNASAETPSPPPAPPAGTGAVRDEAIDFLPSPVVLQVHGAAKGLWNGRMRRLRALASLEEVSQIELSEGSTLVGVCPSLKRFHLQEPGSHPIPCAAPPLPTTPELAPMRYAVDRAVPQLLFPRTGYVRSNPTVRWRSVPGVERYRVELLDGDFEVQWTATVAGTTLVYPETAPPLRDRAQYSFTIVANERSSSEDHTDQLFRVMSSGGQARVQRGEQLLKDLHLQPAAERHLQAVARLRHHLYSEAYELVFRNPSTEAQWLASNALLAVGLHQQATDVLRRVAKPNTQDDLGMARILRRLGKLDGKAVAAHATPVEKR